MPMQNIQRVDSWSQFVKVVQEARTRTAMAGAGDHKVDRATKTGVAVRPDALSRPERTVAAPQKSVGMKTKILGSFFDAYA
jgi:hypothetical protein